MDGEVAIKLSEALKLNTSLTELNIDCNNLLFRFIQLYTDNEIGTEGGIALCEALKSNSSLTSLKIISNRLVLLYFILTQYR
jgi:hypothetical protein